MFYYYTYNYPIGKITIACNESCIVGVWFAPQKYYMDILSGSDCLNKETDVILLAKKWLDQYFNNEKPQLKQLPLELIGSDFRKQVWSVLMDIPYGEVITYKAIAEKITPENGLRNMSAQAVGGAVGHNPISIIIPCHRVVGVNGKLTGYAAGIETKKALLKLEGIDLSDFH